MKQNCLNLLLGMAEKRKEEACNEIFLLKQLEEPQETDATPQTPDEVIKELQDDFFCLDRLVSDFYDVNYHEKYRYILSEDIKDINQTIYSKLQLLEKMTEVKKDENN